ncbi:MAG TPA: hypothetical protein VGP72_30370 [Planctomycetota bacterium]
MNQMARVFASVILAGGGLLFLGGCCDECDDGVSFHSSDDHERTVFFNRSDNQAVNVSYSDSSCSDCGKCSDCDKCSDCSTCSNCDYSRGTWEHKSGHVGSSNNGYYSYESERTIPTCTGCDDWRQVRPFNVEE